jgi:hypothetical protein
MAVPKMVKNGFNSRFQVPEVLVGAINYVHVQKINLGPWPQKKNKNQLKPI